MLSYPIRSPLNLNLNLNLRASRARELEKKVKAMEAERENMGRRAADASAARLEASKLKEQVSEHLI